MFLLDLVGEGSDEDDSGCEDWVLSGSKTTISHCGPCSAAFFCCMNQMTSLLIRLSALPSLWDSIARRRAAAISSSIQRAGWLRTSLVFMDRRRVDITSLPILASSKRVRARDGVDEEEGGGFWGEVSGEEVGWVISRDEVVSGNQLGVTKRPS